MISKVIKLCVISIIVFLNYFETFAQGTIGTERPTTSTSSFTISKNTFQFEQGFAFWNDTTALDGIFRVAVSKRAEIRLFTSYASNSTFLGAKVNLWEQKEYKPGISIQGTIDLRYFRVSWSQKLSDKFGTTFNIGKGEIYYVVLALGYSIGDRASIFIEGVYDDMVQQFNAGGIYLLNSETQLDLSGGLLSNNTSFVALGISRRFLYKN
jgi:hypothetical protein